jgi:putative endonuclease
MAGAWVYMLECADGLYYVGSYRGETIDTRVGEHNLGLYPDAWTYRRRPVTLVWCVHYADIIQAVAFERQLKGWSRAKKQAVIRGEWSDLPELAARRTQRADKSTDLE